MVKLGKGGEIGKRVVKLGKDGEIGKRVVKLGKDRERMKLGKGW